MNRLKYGTIAVGAPGSEARKNAEVQDVSSGLLKALKAAQSRLCEHCPQYTDVVGEQVGDHTDECLAAMDAIATAEGRS